jgi:hypothetical protein
MRDTDQPVRQTPSIENPPHQDATEFGSEASTTKVKQPTRRAIDNYELASPYKRYGAAAASLGVSILFIGIGFLLPNRYDSFHSTVFLSV